MRNRHVQVRVVKDEPEVPGQAIEVDPQQLLETAIVGAALLIVLWRITG